MKQVETWKNVGNKIRHLRKLKQLTIREVADRCDLSVNAISLVERGEVAPSIATLCKIACALDVSASSLFQEACPAEVVLHRSGEPVLESLTDGCIKKLSNAVSGSWVGRPPASSFVESHLTGKLSDMDKQTILCLCGCVILEVDDQTYYLEPGDQLSFNREAFHRWRNSGGATGIAILILPPEKVRNIYQGN